MLMLEQIGFVMLECLIWNTSDTESDTPAQHFIMSQLNTTDTPKFTQPISTLSASTALPPDTTVTVYNIIIILIGVTGIIGNSLVILAIILSRKLRSTLHWFVLNLACVDTCSSLALILGTLLYVILPNFRVSKSHLVSASVFWHLVIGVSLSNHAFIAFTSWYLITKNPAKSKKLFSTRNICFMVAFAWLSPLIASVLIITENDYVGIVIAAWIFGHFVIIVTAYIKIWRFVAQQRKVMKQTKILKNQSQEEIHIDTRSSDKASPCEGGNPDNNTNVLQASQSLEQVTSSECEPTSQTNPEISVHASECGAGHDSKRKTDPKLITLTKHLLVVLFAFVICFIPYAVIQGIGITRVPYDVFSLFVVLLFFNSCINPIIYARRIRVFREVMVCIMRCQLGSIPMPIACLRRRMRRN